jgi:hypothetical protein
MNGPNHDAMRLPWTLENVPHAVLDILRGCNIRCRSCYNSQPDRIKPLAEIEAELDALMRLRRLHSVSIVGGEITLHPELIEIVRLVRRRGLFAELCSNGVELNDHLLAALSQAGANVIFLHIEPNQRRPDLPENATAEDVRRLRTEKAALVAAHGIQAGLTVTAYPEKLAEVEDAFAFALESPHIGWLLVTWCRDINRMPPIHGNLATGMYAESGFAPHLGREEEAGRREIERLLETKHGLKPFGFIGSNLDAADRRWLSFIIGATHRRGKLSCHKSLRPTWAEKAVLELSRKLTGRYPFYQSQRAGQFALHLLLNGLAGGGLAGNLKLLGRASLPGARLSAKRFLFQRPAAFDERGRVVHCQCCPDAVAKNGGLVPLCISDQVVDGEIRCPQTRKPLAQPAGSARNSNDANDYPKHIQQGIGSVSFQNGAPSQRERINGIKDPDK